MSSTATSLCISGGRVIDPGSAVDEVCDVFIDQGRVSGFGTPPGARMSYHVIDASDCYVIPGLVDLAARLREPGAEHKGTIASECRAAAAGGVTTLCLPPDTDPIIDTPAVVELVHQRAEQSGLARVVCLGALTEGLAGERLAEMAALGAIGCVGVSNAQRPIINTSVLRCALEYAANCGMTVHLQCEDPFLSERGLVHEGPTASRLGLTGIPVSAETAALARDLLLVGITRVRAHFCRLSSGDGVNMLRRARFDGLSATGDVGIAHLHLCDEDIGSYDSTRHLRPPLRSRTDVERLRLGVAGGAIAAITSDHQPEDVDSKSVPFGQTAPGSSAVETWLPLTLQLVSDGVLDLKTAIAAVTTNPARILGVASGTLAIGSAADICIFDPHVTWSVTAETLLSAGKNSAFLGAQMRGRTRYTLVGGRIVHGV